MPYCPFCGADDSFTRRLYVSEIPKKKTRTLLYVCYACESFFILQKVIEIPGRKIDSE